MSRSVLDVSAVAWTIDVSDRTANLHRVFRRMFKASCANLTMSVAEVGDKTVQAMNPSAHFIQCHLLPMADGFSGSAKPCQATMV